MNEKEALSYLADIIQSETVPKDYHKKVVKDYEYLLDAAETARQEIVRCSECTLQKDCAFTEWLGKDGFCSAGEIAKEAKI